MWKEIRCLWCRRGRRRLHSKARWWWWWTHTHTHTEEADASSFLSSNCRVLSLFFPPPPFPIPSSPPSTSWTGIYGKTWNKKRRNATDYYFYFIFSLPACLFWILLLLSLSILKRWREKRKERTNNGKWMLQMPQLSNSKRYSMRFPEQFQIIPTISRPSTESPPVCLLANIAIHCGQVKWEIQLLRKTVRQRCQRLPERASSSSS